MYKYILMYNIIITYYIIYHTSLYYEYYKREQTLNIY